MISLSQNRLVVTAAAVGLGLSLTSSASAAALMLDFGPTATVAPENGLSMGHFAGAIPGGETSWNQVAADNSSLVYSDGSSAAGVSVDVGRSDVGVNNVINYNNNTLNSSALGGQFTWGIYTNTSPLKDGIFATGGSAVNTNALGLRINGLAAGSYAIYISGRNTSTAVNAAQRFFVASGASGTTFAFATNTTDWVDEANSGTAVGAGTPTQADGITSTFAYGDNCTHLTVTLSAGQSLYLAAIGIATNEYRGFLNAVQIVPGTPVLTNFPPVIGRMAAGITVYEDATVSLANVKTAGLPTLRYQWRQDGNALPNATNSSLTLSNITAAMGGNYSLAVSNAVGFAVSSNTLVNVIPLKNTGQMTNIWNLVPGDRFYITATNNTSGERGLAYNSVSGNLLVMCQLPTNNIVVLDAATGAEKHFMDLTGVPATAAGINMIGVADDGVVYAGNVTANAGSASTPYNLWRWASDDALSTPMQLLSGDPAYGTGAANLRWGDNLAVRGAGTDTQILIAPGSGTNVCLFTTADGFNFSPTILTISGVPSGFGQFSVAFGPGTDTFWAKTINQALYLVQFDLGTATGTVLQTYAATNGVPNTFRFVSVDKTQKWLAGIMSVASGLPDNVRLYDISSLANGPVLADQELYATHNLNNFLNGAGTGSTAIGDNYVFALDSQNGIKAFLINPNYSEPFNITSIVPSGATSIVLTWQSVAGRSYQVQAKAALDDASWADVGPVITATGASSSFTNTVSGPARFYRVKDQ